MAAVPRPSLLLGQPMYRESTWAWSISKPGSGLGSHPASHQPSQRPLELSPSPSPPPLPAPSAGVQLEAGRVAALLSKMQLTAEAVEGGRAVRVRVPITRSDVLHGEHAVCAVLHVLGTLCAL